MNSFKVTLVSIFFVLKSVDHQHGNSTTKIKQEKFETNQDRKICDDANEMNDDAYLFLANSRFNHPEFRISLLCLIGITKKLYFVFSPSLKIA